MDTVPNSTPTKPVVPQYTFGGMLPPDPNQERQVPDDQKISLREDAPAPDLIKLSDPNAIHPGLSGPTAQQRATKANFGLGENSPGLPVLLNGIQNQTEDALRQSAATAQDVKDRQDRLKVIQDKTISGAPITNEDVSQMASLATWEPKNSPNTIFEKSYADKYVNAMVNVGPTNNVLNQEYAKNPEKVAETADVAHDAVMRQEIVKTVFEDMEARYKNQSWLGWGVDQAKSLFPGYTTLKEHNAAIDAGSWLPGNNKQDQINRLYAMKPDEMEATLRGAMNKLAQDNPSLAVSFAQDLLSHPSSSITTGNLSPLVDIASVLPFGEAGKIGEFLKTSGALAEARRAGAAILKEQGSQDLSKGVYAAAVKANEPLVSDTGAMMSTLGDTKLAAQVNVEKRSGELVGKGDPLGEGSGLKQLPTLMNPEEVLLGAKANLSAQATDRLLTALRANRDSVMDALTNQSTVDRLPEQALQAAFKDTQEALTSRYNHVNDAVIDYLHTRPEDTQANVGAVTVRFGERDASLFETPRRAYQAAIQDYGLAPGAFEVRQQGTGFTVNVTKHLDETAPSVRAALVDTTNQTPQGLGNMFLRWFRSADDRVSGFQNNNRIAAVHGAEGLTDAMKNMAKDIGTLSRTERNDLRRIMEKNKYDVDPATNERGMFYTSQRDLENDYLKVHERLPTEKESKAYWTFVQLNDVDWTMRNLGVFRDRARQGYEQFKLLDREVKPDGSITNFHSQGYFHGKLLDTLPKDQDAIARVVLHTKGEEPQHMILSPKTMTEDQRSQLQSYYDRGYKVIQNVNPLVRPFGDRFGEDHVNFILTKDFENKKLDWSQIPYRPGFHTEYPQSWFIKQPIIRKTGEGVAERNLYEGDKTAMGFNTEAEATKYAQHMDTARQLLKDGKIPELENHLTNNLPFDLKRFKSFFESTGDKDAEFSLDHKFVHTPTGKNTVDYHGNKITSQYTNFDNAVRSPYNLEQNVDKKFMGSRDNPLWTVKESGTELQPVHNVVNAKEVDPFVSVIRGMQNVVRNRYFADYKIQAVESWVQEFGDLLKGVSKEDVLNNPVYHLHNPAFDTSSSEAAQRIAAAKASRDAIVELLGTHSEYRQNLNWVRQKMVDSIYNKTGNQALSDWTYEKLIGDGNKSEGATKLLRSIAFHEKLGFFNPTQFFQNAMTSANAIAIAGTHGLSGTMAGLLMRPLLHGYETPAMIEALAQKAGSIGMSPQMFKDSWAELKKTGLMTVGGEHSWKDNMADPSFFEGIAGKWLDKGTVFFKEGERTSRLTAWNAAFREWSMANPDATLTNAVRNQILKRADLFNANMTRASQASWQQGIFSIPTQFWGYNMRLMEQMVGSRLSMAEKARVIGVNSLLYGVPIGTIGTWTGGVNNFYEDIRKALLDNGVNVDDKAIDAFHSGVVGAMGRLITGNSTNLNEKVGPAGSSALKDLLYDKKFVEIIFGVSGATAKDLMASLDPVTKYALSPFTGQDYPLNVNDAISALRNITTVDSAMKYTMAFQTSQLINKQGIKLDDNMTASEALMGFLTGADPRRLSDAKLMQKMTTDRQSNLDQMEKLISQNYSLFLKAASANDDENAHSYQVRMDTLIKWAGYRPDELGALWMRLGKANEALSKTVPYDFAVKHASPDVAGARLDRETQKRENN